MSKIYDLETGIQIITKEQARQMIPTVNCSNHDLEKLKHLFKDAREELAFENATVKKCTVITTKRKPTPITHIDKSNTYWIRD